MSILSKKKNVFEQIAILKTANELSVGQANLYSAFESSKTKNNKDPFLFMVDLLTILAGSDCINDVITETFTSVGKIEASFKDKLKEELLSQNGGANSDAKIPQNLKDGFKVHINKIDYNRELFTTDIKEIDLYIDQSKKDIINLIKTPNKELVLYKSIYASYNNTTGYITIKPVDMNLSFKTFISNLIDNIDIVNPQILFNTVLDKIFNTRKRKKEEIILEEKMDIFFNKLVTQEEEDDSYFEFNTDDLKDIELKLVSESKLYTEIGCGRVGTELTINHVAKISSGITFPISKKIIQKTLNTTTDVLFDATENASTKQNDKQSIKNSFLNKFLTALKKVLVRTFIASPQINLIFAIANSFNNESDISFNPLEDLKKKKSLIKCMIKKIMNDLLTALFKLLKKEVLEVVSAVAVIYTKEAIERYRKILLSLFKKI